MRPEVPTFNMYTRTPVYGTCIVFEYREGERGTIVYKLLLKEASTRFQPIERASFFS